MLKLFCVVVGEGRPSPFPVDIEAEKTVGDLKKKIKDEKMYQFPADEMDLYLALKDGEWLSDEDHDVISLSQPTEESKALYINDDQKIMATKMLSKYFSGGQYPAFCYAEKIHVLVVVPESAGRSICPKVSVIDLLQQNSLPRMEFMDAMNQQVGFKIPLSTSRHVSVCPDLFTQGEAEYGTCIDTFLDYQIVGSNELSVVSMDSLWLNLFSTLCQCVIFRDEKHESSSSKGTRPDAIITKGCVLFGKVEAKASLNKMTLAIKELTEKMADAAFTTFPLETTSIPAWTTCSSHIQLHQLSYSSMAKMYETRVLRTYNAFDADHRRRFVVDLFKILKWIFPIKEPNALMHLFPQVRTRTTNRHHVTWLKTGLFKEFRSDAKIDMELIERVYSANLQHVERGRCNHVSVTITSIGQTLKNALVHFEGKRNLIIDQVKFALDELHDIGVAHCDVRAANVFVLLSDKRVILGDLEYCRPVYAEPPDVKRVPKDKSCKTALELDKYQFGVFVEELAQM